MDRHATSFDFFIGLYYISFVCNILVLLNLIAFLAKLVLVFLAFILGALG
jgi:hypothetical protein